MRKKRFNFLPLALVCFFFLIPYFVLGASANLFLSPESGTFNVGRTFNVSVKLNSGGGLGVNASEAVLKFDPQYLSVNSISKTGSIFTLWPVEPSFSNTKGEVNFAGGSPTAFTGNSGTIITITFLAKKEGKTEVKFNSGAALAADGIGTNILANMKGGNYELKAGVGTPEPEPEKPQPTPISGLPPLPQVTSLTHPDPEKWYNNNNPEFSWKLPLEVIGVSLLLNDKKSFNPGSVSAGLIESKKYEKIEDGTWYFHIRFQNKSGWGPILHRKVLIDTTPPESFDLTIKKEDATDSRPILQFLTTDKLSGVDFYQIIINDKEVASISSQDLEKNPFYQVPTLVPGRYKIEVKAFDKAGNNSLASKEIEIEPLKYPIFVSLISRKGEFSLQTAIIEKKLPIITTEDWLIIRGTSIYPGAIVKIYITKGKEEPITKEVITDKDGNWYLILDKKLEKGNYSIWGQIFDKRGSQSPETDKIALKVVSPSFLAKYCLVILILLLIVIAVLIYYLFRQKKKFKKEIEDIKVQYGELKEKLSRVFTALKEEIKEQIEILDKRPGLGKQEKELYEKLKEALDVSDAFINEEIKDLEKLLEDKKKKNERKRL